jgi:hypothetical protein|tara:strand:- start:268 stop:435 length:168 start_codon:yes stop_codon:yes gene_type:complete
MSIENLINDVKSGDNIAAGKQFNSVMADKLSAVLDAKKIEIASSLQDRQASKEEE